MATVLSPRTPTSWEFKQTDLSHQDHFRQTAHQRAFAAVNSRQTLHSHRSRDKSLSSPNRTRGLERQRSSSQTRKLTAGDLQQANQCSIYHYDERNFNTLNYTPSTISNNALGGSSMVANRKNNLLIQNALASFDMDYDDNLAATTSGRVNVVFVEISLLVEEVIDEMAAVQPRFEKKRKLMSVMIDDIQGPMYVTKVIEFRLKYGHSLTYTIELLGYLLRKVPFYYRYIANEQTFKYIWRIVDQKYKKSSIHLFKNKIHPQRVVPDLDTHSDQETSQLKHNVMTLVQALFHDLKDLQDYFISRGPEYKDPAANFLIDKYKDLSSKYSFPPPDKNNKFKSVFPVNRFFG